MIIAGRNPVLEALKSGREIAKLYLRYGVTGEAIRDIQHIANKRKIPVSVLDKEKFARVTNNNANAQGVAALVEEITLLTVEDLLSELQDDEPAFFVALDSITDPHNMGAIMRSAHCAGAHGLIIPRYDSAMINDVVIKASAGAAVYLKIARVNNLGLSLRTLKEHGIWLAELAMEGETPLFSFDAAMPLCLVVGSEGNGVRPAIAKLCDVHLRIPMKGKIDSLNASVAAALTMYEVLRKRSAHSEG